MYRIQRGYGFVYIASWQVRPADGPVEVQVLHSELRGRAPPIYAPQYHRKDARWDRPGGLDCRWRRGDMESALRKMEDGANRASDKLRAWSGGAVAWRAPGCSLSAMAV